jgi:hypothetical protein
MKLTKEQRREATKALKFDALAEAGNITGKDYKEDESTESLGVLMHLSSTQSKHKLLSDLGDTTFSMGLDDYLKVVTDYGFEIAYVEDVRFTEPYGKKEKQDSRLYILLHREYSLVIIFDTFYNNTVINGGNLYYNLEIDRTVEGHARVTSSGHVHYDTYDKEADKYLWIGYHDCREGIITNIENMLEVGRFLPQWVESPVTWVTHFSDHYSNSGIEESMKSLDKISATRLAKLPDSLNDTLGVVSGRQKRLKAKSRS